MLKRGLRCTRSDGRSRFAAINHSPHQASSRFLVAAEPKHGAPTTTESLDAAPSPLHPPPPPHPTHPSPSSPPRIPSSSPSTSFSPRASSISSLSALSTLDLDDRTDDARSRFRFSPQQLGVFHELSGAMRHSSVALGSLAVGNVLVRALEAVEHAHGGEHGGDHAAAGLAAEAAGAAAAAVAHGAEGAAQAASSAGINAGVFLEELLRAISLNDVAFCVNAVIPAALILYAVGPFDRLARNPDEPHMALALKGVGRLSLTLQQLAWTAGCVGVVLLLEAAVTYPRMVGVASGACLALAAARGASLWWVLTAHSSSGAEVARTLAALRGGRGAPAMNPLDRAASWLALGALLQAEPPLHSSHGKGHAHAHRTHGAAAAAGSDAPAAAAVPYSFSSEEERVLRALVEAGNTAGIAIGLQVLALLALGVAQGATDDSAGLVSNGINAVQKVAGASLLFASSAAFDEALHNDDGHDDTEHLLAGLGAEHSGMAGLFNGTAILSWALLVAGAVGLLAPSLEESPLGVAVGEGVIHTSLEVLVDFIKAI